MSTTKIQLLGGFPQSDFAQTDSTQPDYIKNKPEIATEVTENSDSLITSGGVYEALQNIGGSEVSWEDIVDRPFYEGVITMTMPTDISNSTVISSQSVSTVGGLQFTYVKVGDAYWNSKEDVVGAIMNVDYQLQGTNFDVTVEVNDVVSLGENGFGVLYANNGVFPLSMTIHSVGTVIFPTSGAYGEDLVFNVTETGTYLLNISGMCVVTSFENEQLKQIDSKFIPSGVCGGGVSEWEDIQNKPGDPITTTIETNNSYTTTLGAPTVTSPFAIWRNLSASPSEIYDNIQENTPITVSYMVDGNIVEIESLSLFTNSTFDTQFGIGSDNTGYYGVVNANQTAIEIFTNGIWTRRDSNKPTFVVLLEKSNINSKSRLHIAAPENLAGNTFIVSISTTETESTTIKLANEAINIDNIPTEGSSNFLTSGVIKGLKDEIDQTHYFKSEIETMLSTKQPLLTFDIEPLENSTNPVTSNGIYNAIVNVIEVAEGKRKSYVFDDVSSLDLWLSAESNVDLLQIGDVFLLRSTTEPDYWWDGETKQILDTNMDLDGYATIEYVDDKLGDIDAIIAQIEAIVGGA